MQLVVITGMSGAGKVVAAKAFEDMGYAVTDNLPPPLLPALVEQCRNSDSDAGATRLAVVCDARAGKFFAGLAPALSAVKEQGVAATVLFLDASDNVLVQRFKETRRRHPLFDMHGGILQGIQAERSLLEATKDSAGKTIDTSSLSPAQLREALVSDFALLPDKNQGLTVTVTSFGFKYGLPLDADLVFDVRFLINPHYIDSLRPFDGRDPKIEAYVMQDPDAPIFLGKLYDLIDWSVPQYVEEGKAYLTVAIGCTGGRHRSVLVAEKLGAHLQERGYRALIQHRDVGKANT